MLSLDRKSIETMRPRVQLQCSGWNQAHSTKWTETLKQILETLLQTVSVQTSTVWQNKAMTRAWTRAILSTTERPVCVSLLVITAQWLYCSN